MQWITEENTIQYNPNRFLSGADIYGREIIQTQKAHWDALFGDDVAISVRLPLPKLVEPLKPHRLLIQYLHTYPYKRPLGDVSAITKWAGAPVVFLTAYRAFRDYLEANGFRAVYVPMGITRFEHAATRHIQNRFIWFGNLYSEKGRLHRLIRETLRSHGIQMDTISKGEFNGQPVTRQEALGIIGQYRFGIGVGKCAQEMFSMRLKVLIAGSAFGGVAMTEEDEAAQLATNYNGRIITFSESISKCIEALPHSRACGPNYLEDANHADLFRASPYFDEFR